MHEYAIETTDLSKRFYPSKNLKQFVFNPWGKTGSILAVDRASLQIKKGELFVLVGPNGAGKTTLIKILAGLILPTKGNARVNGYDVVKDEMRVKESIGLLAGDERSFYGRLTGRENLSFFACLYNIPRKKAEKRIGELAGFLEIGDLDRRFQEYSAGIKQRLAVARGLLNNPQIIFMDEPTKNLDPLAAEDLRSLIKRGLVETQGKTVLFCTHNLSEAVALGMRIAIMHKGEIKACGTVEELRKEGGLAPHIDIKDVFKHYVSK